jgi:hypothetical protein
MINKMSPADPPPTQTKLPNIGDINRCMFLLWLMVVLNFKLPAFDL